MKKIMFTTLMLLVVLSVNGFAVTGSISYSTGLNATDGWANTNTILSWEVSEDPYGIWTYAYTFGVPQKGISHVIIEVSDTFGPGNILSGTTSGYTLDTYYAAGPGNSNPGIPGDLYGIKWDTPEGVETLTYEFTIVTNRAPMWGNFYAKDGKDGNESVYAYNTNFSITGPVYNSNEPAPDGWALVPDTQTSGVIPEPGTFLLLGSGLLGLALYRRKRK